MTAYLDFIAAGVTPEQIIAFKPTPKAQERLEELLWKSKNAALTSQEEQELNHFREMEHLVRMAKARARQHVQNR